MTSQTSSAAAKKIVDKIVGESPEIADSIFAYLMTLPIEIDGKTDTVMRHTVRSWGLNPEPD